MTSKSRGSSPVSQSNSRRSSKQDRIMERAFSRRLNAPSKRAKTLTDLVNKLTGKSEEKRNSF